MNILIVGQMGQGKTLFHRYMYVRRLSNFHTVSELQFGGTDFSRIPNSHLYHLIIRCSKLRYPIFGICFRFSFFYQNLDGSFIFSHNERHSLNALLEYLQ